MVDVEELKEQLCVLRLGPCLPEVFGPTFVCICCRACRVRGEHDVGRLQECRRGQDLAVRFDGVMNIP
jgi:hypothetical protein